MAAQKDYGRRLVVNIIDEMARDEPDRIVYSLPLTANVADGFRNVTAWELANAINRTAAWIESQVGKGTDFPTVGYMGPHNDFRYILVIFSCIKAGYKALLPSPRNSVEATVAILNRSETNIWITPAERPEALDAFLAARPMKVLNIASIPELLNKEPVPHYEYNKTFQEASEDPFLVLHTSGSTGLPKPIVWKNSLVGTVDAYRLLPPEESHGRPPWTVIFNDGDPYYSAFPLYHGAGLIMNVLIRAFYGTRNYISPFGVLSTINVIDALLDCTDIKTWSIMPSIIDEIGETPKVKEKFRGHKAIVASGGPVTFGSAEKAAEAVRVVNLTGTTESMFQGMVLVDREDWIYFSFHPWGGFEFRQLEEGIYEHYAVRNEKHKELFQGVFHTFPDIDELNYKDLYKPHPTKPDMWLYRGRTDELLVLSNGEKVRPLAMEAIINSHPEVNACLMIGTGYTMTSLIVELANPEPKDPAEREKLLDSILVKVHEANAIASTQARIFREYIWFTKPEKPFIRTDKNTVKRRDTVLQYEEEIVKFYKDLESEGNLAADFDFSSPSTIEQGLRRLLVAANVANADQIQGDDDLLHSGVDSLTASSIANTLRSSLKKRNLAAEGDGLVVTTRLIYTHPTINALTEALYAVAHKTAGAGNSAVDQQGKTVDEFLSKYGVSAAKSSSSSRATSPADGATVILTGSTGSLGSYLLNSLLQLPQVKKVYALNRSEDGKAKQKESSEPRGLDTNWSQDKVEFLQVDLAKENFGLSAEAYGSLLKEATHIIHNQWPVNYNWDIASFEPQMRGIRNLLDFAHESAYNASVFFVSSVATVSHLRPDGTVPEAPNHRYREFADGYGSSKQAAELLLEQEAAKTDLKAAAVRVGQIGGPVLRGSDKGMWPKHEWLPTLIASSKYLGVLPSSLGTMSRVDWIPVDLLSDVLVQLALADAPEGKLSLYHAVNPKAVEWESIVPAVAKRLGESVKMVSWAEWVDELRSSARAGTTTQSLKQNPALKLIEYFEGVAETAAKGEKWPVLDTSESVKQSKTLAELPAVSEKWLDLWLDQWKF